MEKKKKKNPALKGRNPLIINTPIRRTMPNAIDYALSGLGGYWFLF
jgi:hypothetical protein